MSELHLLTLCAKLALQVTNMQAARLLVLAVANVLAVVVDMVVVGVAAASIVAVVKLADTAAAGLVEASSSL